MICVEHLTKSYLDPRGRRHYVYRDLSLQLPGRTNIGVIGANGSGKSTLLRLLAGSERADRGRVVADGRISPPIGMSSGVSVTLSGRDNARFACRILGDTPAAQDVRMRWIHAVSETEDFFDQPVKIYSSGMRGRLAFAISMAFEHDYYLIDEITASGDGPFRARAESMFQSKRGNASVIMVSHNFDALRRQCDVGVYVRRGGAEYFDDINRAIDAYQRDLS